MCSLISCEQLTFLVCLAPLIYAENIHDKERLSTRIGNTWVGSAWVSVDVILFYKYTLRNSPQVEFHKSSADHVFIDTLSIGK